MTKITDPTARALFAGRTLTRTGGALTALVILAGLVGCGGSDAASASSSTGGEPTETDGGVVVGPDGRPVAPPAPESPVVGGKPPEGVFVSSSKGIDGADGSILRPLKTLAAAIELAKTKPGLPVNACAETYTEAVKLVDGVTMFGYYDCSTPEWRRIAKHANVLSPTSPALLAENLTLPTKFEGFDVTAPDLGGAPGAGLAALSSYGAIVRTTKGLTLADVTLRGGNGQDGVDGVDSATNNVDTGGRAEGVSADTQRDCSGAGCLQRNRTMGRPGGTSACAVGLAGGAGGQGGDGPFLSFGAYREQIGAGADGRPAVATATTAAGTWRFGFKDNVPGFSGSAGAPGAVGQNGGWSVSAEGFAPGNGTAGAVGLPGQGGGGGPGTTEYWVTQTTPATVLPNGQYFGATGAGGGAGGCGGLPGTAGSGGGASIGLFMIASEVILADARIEGRKGGHAGKGAVGLAGVPGGSGGWGHSLGMQDIRGPGIFGGPGGKGGAGGAAGLSGHGSPGASIALAYSGARPQTLKVDLVPGDPGEGFPAVVQGTQTLPAIVGIGKAEHAF